MNDPDIQKNRNNSNNDFDSLYLIDKIRQLIKKNTYDL